MSAKLPDENNRKKTKDEPFGEIIKSMNTFFNEKPVRGFLQSIDDFFKSPFPPSASFQVKTVETDKEIIITAELPGIKREQIHLDILGNQLTISIENNDNSIEEDEKNQLFRSMQLQVHSSRTINLPKPINDKKVKASYHDGLLQIRIPQQKGKIIHIEED
ncbi:Hsp20/alpha crystallin family protein [Neobacillus sp. PS3-40]|uniref:Hsp20/alpha crystallin family protein n=1 Tax=Neobacillus sp. PS3-40 TaxID=3070679 RepID=UPI0027E08129|nr:Hsp20/alpha crystallin family protein [Neobacillus sp. PS3-40]WML45070.1 Hsp20/alpha crystallin family protein [Neobacillus sp. PS3-40]